MVDPMPFLKWAGGKSDLISDIVARFPEGSANKKYVEPFIGGGSVLIAVLDRNLAHTAVAADANAVLISAYIAIRDDVDNFIAKLTALKADTSEAAYYRVRAEYNSNPTPEALVYLNKTCFRGLYRTNQKGEFNVPFGNNKNPTIFDNDNLKKLSALFQRVRFVCSDWEVTLAAKGPADDPASIWYLDPPYATPSAASSSKKRTRDGEDGAARASFTQYQPEGFSEEQQARLIERSTASQAHVIYSNHENSGIRAALEASGDVWSIDTLNVRRRINSKNPKDSAVEMLATKRVRTNE
jgi:DNA adenine methylase